MSVLPACTYGHHICAVLSEVRKGYQCPGPGATVAVVVSSHVFAGKLNIGLLEEQQVLKH